jgi:acyl dehydratase
MFFEDFKEGTKYSTNGRTISEADSILFSTLTGAYNPLFLDETHAAKTQFKTRIVLGLLTVSICTGLVYQLPIAPFGEGFVALVAMTTRWSKPVYPGYTLRSEVIVTDKKDLKDNRGLVTLTARVLNQDSELVSEIEYRIMVMQRMP